jgi:hypothetical protein
MGLGSKLSKISKIRKSWDQTTEAAKDLGGSIQADPMKALSVTGLGNVVGYGSGLAAAVATGQRTVEDMKDQAAGLSDKEQARAAAAAAYAQTLIPQAADLGDIRRQRIRRLAMSRSTSGLPSVLGAPTGAKTALGL